MRQPQLHPIHPPTRTIPIRHLLCGIMLRLVIDPDMRVGSARAEPIDTHPRQDLIVSPSIPIRPVHQFLVDPRQERNRAICKSVRERLRLSSLQDAVRLALVNEPLRALYAFLLRLGVGLQCMLERQCRLCCEARRLGSDHVDVAC